MQYRPVTLIINEKEIDAELSFYHTPEIRGVNGLGSYCPEEWEEWELVRLTVDVDVDGGDHDCSWMLPYIEDSLIEQLKSIRNADEQL